MELPNNDLSAIEKRSGKNARKRAKMNGTQIATRCTDLDCDESDEDNKESELWKQTRLEATKKPRPSVRYFAVVAGIQLRDEEHQEAKTQKRQQQGGREAAGCAVG